MVKLISKKMAIFHYTKYTINESLSIISTPIEVDYEKLIKIAQRAENK
jgi:hypothetical protein